ncbi:MAG: class I mannose-6-phosphate isomerase [Gemmataceae bacterium]|nr:class I mannose-6-phosphate isomerase [Gemmataceae bacterium]
MVATFGPLRFEPYFRPMPWGGRALATLLGKPLPPSGCFGESWEVSDHPRHRSVVACGPGRGTSLRQLMLQHPVELLGEKARQLPTFPWLIKFLDCRELLSVQVHPDSAAAAALCPNEGSKTEAWYVLHAETASRIYAGLRPGIGPSELRTALDEGTVADCLHSFVPQAGDCVFLPAGTVHAVGGGVLLAEIQETSDATFRLFDWNRVDAHGQARPLHINEALTAIHWEAGPVQPDRAPADADRWTLVRAEPFHLELVRARWEFATGPRGTLNAVIVLAGTAHWSASGAAVQRGDVWVVPAAAVERRLVPTQPLEALLATWPAQ